MDIPIYFSFLSSQFAKLLPRDYPRGNTALNTHSGICSLNLGFERDSKMDTEHYFEKDYIAELISRKLTHKQTL